jgi:hypothetical protein
MVPYCSRAATMKALRPLVMTWYGVLFALVMKVSIIEGFVFGLDLKLDSALQKGGALSRNKGAYLYDSFRYQIIMFI